MVVSLHGSGELDVVTEEVNLYLNFRSILSQKSSRNLFFFLLINFSFAIVELLYGMWMNR